MRLSLPSPKCKHRETITIRAGGIERIVCENCGLLSFSFDVEPHPRDHELEADRQAS